MTNVGDDAKKIFVVNGGIWKWNRITLGKQHGSIAAESVMQHPVRKKAALPEVKGQFAGLHRSGIFPLDGQQVSRPNLGQHAGPGHCQANEVEAAKSFGDEIACFGFADKCGIRGC